MRALDRPHIRKDNVQRLQTITDLGVKINDTGEAYCISCKTAPKMFLGLYVLCSASNTKYKYMNYLRLDYKGYFRGIPGIEDIKQTMTKQHAANVDLIIKSVISDKMKYKVKPLRSITSSHGWKVEYTLKGKNVFGFFSEPDYLALYIYFNEAKNITEMSRNLKNDTLLFDWFCDKFPKVMCKCLYNVTVMLGDEKRRICGMSNKAEIVNPGTGDVEKVIAVIKMFRGL